MLQANDLKYIMHFFIHNPIEKEKGRMYQGVFPLGVEKDQMIYVRNKKTLKFGTFNTPWVLYDGKSNVDMERYQRKVFHYICNPDGSIRWIYPSTLKKPLFLKFYSTVSLRAKFIAWMYIVLFKLGLKKMGHTGSFTVYHDKTKKKFKHFLMDGNNQFSLFTGTIGPNRKALLVAKYQKSNEYFYVKIPLTDKAFENMMKELRFLQHYRPVSTIHVPRVKFWNDPPYLFLSDIKPTHASQPNKLNNAHIKFIMEHALQATSVALSRSKVLKMAAQRFNETDFSRIPEVEDLKQNLGKVFQQTFLARKNILVTTAHGDFTPWNCYTKNDDIYVFDWEMVVQNAPVLFDLFHFIVQKGILVEKKSFKQIKSEVFDSLNIPSVSWFINKHGINPIEYFKYYLLVNASYYLKLYSEQVKLHEQVKWQVDFWKEAFSYFADMQSPFTYKGVFIERLGKFLSDKKYALIKRIVNPLNLYNSNSDLDLLVTKKLATQIYQYCRIDAGITHVSRIKHAHMHTLEIYFDDLTYLRVDLLFAVRRKNKTFVEIQQALDSAVMLKNGWKYIARKYELDYVKGFYWLNNQDIPQKYITFYHFTPQDLTYHRKKEFRRSISKLNSNRWYYQLWNGMVYLMDVLIHITVANGFVITYSGVDGAGKTTVLEHVAAILKSKYRKEIVILRHRPSLLPIISAWFYGKKKAESIAASMPPHSGNNGHTFQSYLRFFYYLLDYLFGQLYVYFRYVAKGYVVIYDRYYFDFISDPRRSNIVVDRRLALFFYRFLIKPKLNFFLYADPETIMQRKRELTEEEINQLTEDYRKLFAQYSNRYKKSRYLIIKNDTLIKTLSSVERELVYHIN